jgi:hypothetical protein
MKPNFKIISKDKKTRARAGIGKIDLISNCSNYSKIWIWDLIRN